MSSSIPVLEEVHVNALDEEEGGRGGGGGGGATAAVAIDGIGPSSSIARAHNNSDDDNDDDGNAREIRVPSPSSPPKIPRHDRSSQGVVPPVSDITDAEDEDDVIASMARCHVGGGPGWFKDIFNVAVEFESDMQTLDTLNFALVPRPFFKRRTCVFEIGAPIKGVIRLTAPPGKKVWLAGVRLELDESLLVVELDKSTALGKAEINLSVKPRWVHGVIELPFVISLEKMEQSRGWATRETYIGEMIALRHQLIVILKRPWYTFDVYHYEPLVLEKLEQAPLQSQGPPNEEEGPNHTMVIPDCHGRAVFDFGCDSFNMDDVIVGELQLQGVSQPIQCITLVLLKAEFMFGSVFESVVSEHYLCGDVTKTRGGGSVGRRGGSRRNRDGTREHNSEFEGENVQQNMEEEDDSDDDDDSVFGLDGAGKGSGGGGAPSPFVTMHHPNFITTRQEGMPLGPVGGNDVINVSMDLSKIAFTPTFLSLAKDMESITSEQDLVGVRYYIRCILIDSTSQHNAFWNTHEIFIHRNRICPMDNVIAVGYEEDDDGDDDDGDGDDVSDDDISILGDGVVVDNNSDGHDGGGDDNDDEDDDDDVGEGEEVVVLEVVEPGGGGRGGGVDDDDVENEKSLARRRSTASNDARVKAWMEGDGEGEGDGSDDVEGGRRRGRPIPPPVPPNEINGKGGGGGGGGGGGEEGQEAVPPPPPPPPPPLPAAVNEAMVVS